MSARAAKIHDIILLVVILLTYALTVWEGKL